MKIIIRVAPIMETRPCRFCLALQDDSVFADFDVDSARRIFLCRISFDGYGCCHCESTSTRMGLSDSELFIAAVKKGNFYDAEVQHLLIKYFHENSRAIWLDALADHGLLVAE
jgi:hypothetical protein